MGPRRQGPINPRHFLKDLFAAAGKPATYAPRFAQGGSGGMGDNRGTQIANGVLTYHLPCEWRSDSDDEVNHAQ